MCCGFRYRSERLWNRHFTKRRDGFGPCPVHQHSYYNNECKIFGGYYLKMITFAKKKYTLPMASIRDLKKDINYVLGDIIEAVYLVEGSNKKDSKEGSAVIDGAIST